MLDCVRSPPSQLAIHELVRDPASWHAKLATVWCTSAQCSPKPLTSRSAEPSASKRTVGGGRPARASLARQQETSKTSASRLAGPNIVYSTACTSQRACPNLNLSLKALPSCRHLEPHSKGGLRPPYLLAWLYSEVSAQLASYGACLPLTYHQLLVHEVRTTG
jgi:hypothetical protein